MLEIAAVSSDTCCGKSRFTAKPFLLIGKYVNKQVVIECRATCGRAVTFFLIKASCARVHVCAYARAGMRAQESYCFSLPHYHTQIILNGFNGLRNKSAVNDILPQLPATTALILCVFFKLLVQRCDDAR